MKFRKLVTIVAGTAVMTTTAVWAPSANAGQVTVSGDVCKIEYTQRDDQRRAIWSENRKETAQKIVADLKREMPNSAADLDIVLAGSFYNEYSEEDPYRQALERFLEAAEEKGHHADGLVQLISEVRSALSYERGNYYTNGISNFTSEDRLPRSEARKWVDRHASFISDLRSSFYSAAELREIDKLPPESWGNGQADIPLMQACADGYSGYVDLDFGDIEFNEPVEEPGGNTDVAPVEKPQTKPKPVTGFRLSS